MARANAANAKRMLQSEKNRVNVLKHCNEWITISEIAKKMECCNFVVLKAMRALKEHRCVDTKKEPGARQSVFYKANGTPYIKKTFDELLQFSIDGTMPVVEKVKSDFFNPWEPKIPQGIAVHEYNLWNKKAGKGYKRPRPISIASSFSLYDGF